MKQPDTPWAFNDFNPLDAVGVLVFLMLAITIGVGWFIYYVQPREDFLLTVAECTGEDSSEAAWERCSEQVRAEKVR